MPAGQVVMPPLGDIPTHDHNDQFLLAVANEEGGSLWT